MSELVMIDTSCWIPYFRGTDKKIEDEIVFLLSSDKAAICGIVELEVVQGIKNKKHEYQVRELVSYIKYLPFEREDFVNAGKRMNRLRKKGITLAVSDSLIAEICIRNHIKLLTNDADFKQINEIEFWNQF